MTELETLYRHDVDHGWGRNAASFYPEHGLFVVGGKRMQGRAEISEFCRWRAGRVRPAMS